MNENTLKSLRFWLILSILLFALSLFFPAFYIASEADKSYFSLNLLLTGWLGVLVGYLPAVSWLANPFILAAWSFSYKHRTLAIMLNGFALVFSGIFLFVDEILIDEAGHYAKITALASGYYLWLCSQLVFFTGLFLAQKKRATK